MPEFPCPCCGYLVFDEPPGSYDICPICGWEDDLAQLRFPQMGGGANRVSLLEGQRNVAAYGYSDSAHSRRGRQPSATDVRDPNWLPLDEAQDEVPEADHGPTDPADPTELYYWRSTPPGSREAR